MCHDYFVSEIPIVDLWGLLVIILGFLRRDKCLVAEFYKEASIGTINWVAKVCVMGILSNKVFLLAAVVAAAAISDKTVLSMAQSGLYRGFWQTENLLCGPQSCSANNGIPRNDVGICWIQEYSGLFLLSALTGTYSGNQNAQSSFLAS